MLVGVRRDEAAIFKMVHGYSRYLFFVCLCMSFCFCFTVFPLVFARESHLRGLFCAQIGSINLNFLLHDPISLLIGMEACIVQIHYSYLTT